MNQPQKGCQAGPLGVGKEMVSRTPMCVPKCSSQWTFFFLWGPCCNGKAIKQPPGLPLNGARKGKQRITIGKGSSMRNATVASFKKQPELPWNGATNDHLGKAPQFETPKVFQKPSPCRLASPQALFLRLVCPVLVRAPELSRRFGKPSVGFWSKERQ